MSDWDLVYGHYDPAEEGRRESLCALGNGFFVSRGAAPDSVADAVHYPGTYLAGCYDRRVSEVHGERVENEDLVNLPNWLPLLLRIDDGEWVRAHDLELLDYRQRLDLRAGLLHRLLRFQDGSGRVTRWDERRFVSMHDRNVAGLAVRITAESWAGRLAVRSAIDGSVVNDGVARYRELEGRHLETVETSAPEPDLIFLHARTVQSRREIAVAARTRFYRDAEELTPQRSVECQRDLVQQVATLSLSEGESVQVEKLAALFPSVQPAISEAGLEARSKAAALPRFDSLLADHTRAWAHLWQEADLRLGGVAGQADAFDHEIKMTLRLHIFHLLQTVSYHTVELDAGVPPRGWHGEAYRGHILWDELFVFPFLILRLPSLARSLLRYRYRRLGRARAAAREAGLAGAMFPWQSGSNGREESQRIHLNPVSGRWIPDNSHRQRHIGAAVAFNVWQYYQATEDHEFMSDFGAELLLEVARFWASVAEHDAVDDRYHIRGVMGPDEFHTAYPGRDPAEAGGLDDNAYTNVMASWVLSRSLDVLALLPDARRDRLCESVGLGQAEIDLMDTVSRRLRVPFMEDGIIGQFEGYQELEELDWASLEAKHGSIQRLDRVLEAEGDTPNRYKASKQADVLMLFYLFSADELSQILERLGYSFDHRMIPANVEYYLARTSHGSTLSRVVHSWVLARANRPRSWKMFCDALRSDVADIQDGTTPEGIHLGAMAGTVDIMQRCYTGIETRQEALHLDPALPDELAGLRTQVRYRAQILDIEIDHQELRVSSRPFTALPVTISYRGHVRQISPGQSHCFRLVKPPAERECCGD